MSTAPTLVLGSSGFLGPHVVAALAERGLRVLSAARRPEAAPVLGSAPGEPCPVDLAALAQEHGALDAWLDERDPGAVISCAALAQMDACERDPEGALAINATVPELVARWCSRAGVSFVHVSTDLVFGAEPPRGERYAEDDQPSPLSVYGRTKAEGEVRVLKANARALVARLPLLVGDSGGRGIGASDSILAALERGERPRLFVDEWRTPLAAEDAGRALAELHRDESDDARTRGIVHLAGPTRCTRLELGLAVLRAAGRDDAEALVEPARRADAGLAELRPRDASLAVGRARALLRTQLGDPLA